jgi:hypothetical protein
MVCPKSGCGHIRNYHDIDVYVGVENTGFSGKIGQRIGVALCILLWLKHLIVLWQKCPESSDRVHCDCGSKFPPRKGLN